MFSEAIPRRFVLNRYGQALYVCGLLAEQILGLNQHGKFQLGADTSVRFWRYAMPSELPVRTIKATRWARSVTLYGVTRRVVCGPLPVPIGRLTFMVVLLGFTTSCKTGRRLEAPNSTKSNQSVSRIQRAPPDGAGIERLGRHNQRLCHSLCSRHTFPIWREMSVNRLAAWMLNATICRTTINPCNAGAWGLCERL